MGSSCSCCSDDDSSEKGLPLLSSEVKPLSDLPLNSRRKHIIKALHAVLSVGIRDVASLFGESRDYAAGGSSGVDKGPASSSTSNEDLSVEVVDDLIAALARALMNLDANRDGTPSLSYKQRLEMINRATPLSEDLVRKRLEILVNRRPPPSQAPSTNSTPKNATTEMDDLSAVRFRSQSMAPPSASSGDANGSASRYYLPRILELWFRADADCSGSLEKSEIKELLHEVNLETPSAQLDALFKEADTSRNGTLEFNEFVQLYARLTQVSSVAQLARRLGVSVPQSQPTAPSSPGSNNNPSSANRRASRSPLSDQPPAVIAPQNTEVTIIPVEPLRNFFEVDQREHDQRFVSQSLQRAGRIRTYMTSNGASSVSGITEREFQMFLLDASCNSWMHPRESTVNMDMTQPYPHYFCDSSHNTYLTGHQLKGLSSCDMYKRALLTGCRCLELDCWDGQNGDPKVTHGFTLTTHLRFYDVIQTIKTYAFQTSPFAVMLSIELHTSLPQQETMVRMMREAWGTDLLTAADAERSQLMGREFSAEGLKGKILVKSKRLPTAPNATQGSAFHDRDPDQHKGVISLEELILMERQEAEDRKLEAAAGASEQLRDTASTTSATIEPQTPSVTQTPAATPKLKHAISEALNNVTYIAAMPFVSPEAQKKKPHYGVSSIDENKIERWFKENPFAYIEIAKRFLLRVYPKGLRADSSNFIPQLSWNCGAQFVALNIQTNDDGYRLNRYWFRANGKCGMILKPSWMRDMQRDASLLYHMKQLPVSDWGCESVTVSITILCGVQLPKPNRKTRGEVIDPYVEVCISGFGADDTFHDKKKTRVIPNNGFNPEWNETFSFSVRLPEMAMLVVRLREHDTLTSDALIGDNAIPLGSLREGYRCVPLYVDGVQMPSPTCIFARIKMDRIALPTPPTPPPEVTPPPPQPPLTATSTGENNAGVNGEQELDSFTAAHMDML